MVSEKDGLSFHSGGRIDMRTERQKRASMENWCMNILKAISAQSRRVSIEFPALGSYSIDIEAVASGALRALKDLQKDRIDRGGL